MAGNRELLAKHGMSVDQIAKTVKLDGYAVYDLSSIVRTSFQWRQGERALFGPRNEHVRLVIEVDGDSYRHHEIKFKGRSAVKEAEAICQALTELAEAARGVTSVLVD